MVFVKQQLVLVYLYTTLVAGLLPPVTDLIYAVQAGNTTSAWSAFDWDTVISSRDIVWHPCYDKYNCARLTLPLDWNNESNPNTVSLALIRLPATVPESDAKYGGTVITNPGGPGGPGTLWALANAEKLQKRLDGPKHYEILSFDPRGIFSTQPNAYCFKNGVESEIWYDQKEAVGGLDSSDYAQKYNWAAVKARGELCATTENGKYENGDNIRQYSSTAYVARDILEIVRKLDEQKAVSVRSEGEDGQRPIMGGKADRAQHAKLQYWGTSYGTLLGQTFASMYPEHVGRMVLDANVDPENWVSLYEAGIEDHNKIREYFYERCFSAKSECAFYRKSDTSASDVEKRFHDLQKSLDRFPAYAQGEGRAMPITRTDVEQGFMTTSYQPVFYFKPFAQFLHDLTLNANPGIPFWERPVPTKDTFTDKLLQFQYQGGEAGDAVHCSDGPLLSDEPFSGFQAYLGNLTEQFGSSSAALQADYKLPCWTWPKSLRTKWRFDGPFEGDAALLFVNNRLDPATSTNNAKKMANRFKGSVALEQDSAGHGALWPPGECIWKYVKQYMNTGEMPSKGTVCEPLCVPFGKPCEGVDMPEMR